MTAAVVAVLSTTMGNAMAQPPVGANSYGDYVISADGLGNGGFAAISERGNHGDLRLYLYTGPNPSTQGNVFFYVVNQPSQQHPFITLTLATTDPVYLGAFAAGFWPFPSQLVASYWNEYPTLIVSWQTATRLMPHSGYSINVHAEPRPFNPYAHDVEMPGQAAGVGKIQ
jgi:hypothetical protein